MNEWTNVFCGDRGEATMYTANFMQLKEGRLTYCSNIGAKGQGVIKDDPKFFALDAGDMVSLPMLMGIVVCLKIFGMEAEVLFLPITQLEPISQHPATYVWDADLKLTKSQLPGV